MPEQVPPRVSPGRGLRVFSVRGVPVFVSPVALLFAVLFGSPAITVAENRLGDLVGTQSAVLLITVALGFLLSLVLHELGHAIVAQQLRFDVRSVTVYGFAGITEYRPEPQTPGKAFLIAIVGPSVNLALGGILSGIYAVVDPQSLGAVALFDLAFVNVALGIFNLLPGLPLDGGHALQSALWKVTRDRGRATRAAAYVGFVLAGVLVVWGISFTEVSDQLLVFVTASLLGMGAYQSLQQARVRARLPGLTAGALARPALPVDASLPLAEALRRAQAAGATAVVVVDGHGEPSALMSGAAADATPPERRPWVTISSVSRSLEPGLEIPAELSGQELLSTLERSPASEYLVRDADGKPAGVLAAVDLVARLDPAAASRMAARR